MTGQQTMNTIIHAAFRRDLARFDAALYAFPAGSRQRADDLGAAWENFAYQLHHHHQEEETIFFPALRELGAGDTLFGDLEEEHAAMLAALKAANGAMRALRSDPSSGNAEAARRSLGELKEVTDAHLAHEERDLEPFAASHAATPQLKAANTAVRRSLGWNATGTFFAWLTDGADPGDVAALRRVIPPPV
ncbi:MAG: hemerythrin domain-containing protein, partial [Trebonia sp.]